MDIKELIRKAREEKEDITGEFRQKSIQVPAWKDLVREYEPAFHPVMDEVAYPDILITEERLSDTQVDQFGNPDKVTVVTGTEKVSRVTYALQKLAAKRTTELCFGIPIQRVYKPQNDRQKEQLAIFDNNSSPCTCNHSTTPHLVRSNTINEASKATKTTITKNCVIRKHF